MCMKCNDRGGHTDEKRKHIREERQEKSENMYRIEHLYNATTSILLLMECVRELELLSISLSLHALLAHHSQLAIFGCWFLFLSSSSNVCVCVLVGSTFEANHCDTQLLHTILWQHIICFLSRLCEHVKLVLCPCQQKHLTSHTNGKPNFIIISPRNAMDACVRACVGAHNKAG